MRYLCRLPQYIDAQDNTGNTALHHACERDRPRMVYNLLLMDTDRNIKNQDDKTALDIAKASSNMTIINLFVGLLDIAKLA